MGANASQFSYLELLTRTANVGSFSDSMRLLGTYDNTPLETLTMFHSSRK